jgi:hypothetical protein
MPFSGGAPGAGIWKKLADVTSATLTATIPTGYPVIHVVALLQGSGGAPVATMRFNNRSTAGDYRWNCLVGSGTTASATQSASDTSISLGIVDGGTIQTIVADISNHASASAKLVVATTPQVGGLTVCAGQFLNATEITRIDIIPASLAFTAGSRMLVFGAVV